MRYLSILSLGFFISSSGVFDRVENKTLFLEALIQHLNISPKAWKAFVCGVSNFDMFDVDSKSESERTLISYFMSYIENKEHLYPVLYRVFYSSDFPLSDFLSIVDEINILINRDSKPLLDKLFLACFQNAGLPKKSACDYLVRIALEAFNDRKKEMNSCLYSLCSLEIDNCSMDDYLEALADGSPSLSGFLDTIFNFLYGKNSELFIKYRNDIFQLFISNREKVRYFIVDAFLNNQFFMDQRVDVALLDLFKYGINLVVNCKTLFSEQRISDIEKKLSRFFSKFLMLGSFSFFEFGSKKYCMCPKKNIIFKLRNAALRMRYQGSMPVYALWHELGAIV
jgi:hypothetical protein